MLSVFVAEDNAVFGQSVCQKLKKAGCVLLGWAQNGQTALQDILLFKPQLVLIDIQMPLLDGLEVIEKARASGCSAQFIIISAYSDFTFAQRAIQLGVTDYLLKPFSNAQLTALLNAAEQCTQDEQHALEREELQKLLSHYPAQPLPYGNFCLAVVNVGPYACDSAMLENPFFSMITPQQTESAVAKALAQDIVCLAFQGMYRNEILVVFATQLANPDCIRPSLPAQVLPCAAPVHICVGDWFPSQEQLFSHLVALRRFLHKGMHYGSSTLLQYSNNDVGAFHAIPCENWNTVLQKKQWSLLQHALQAQMVSWQACSPPQWWLEQQVYALARALDSNLSFLTQNTFLSSALRALSSCESYAAFGNALMRIAQACFEQSNEGYTATTDSALENVAHYLEVHYPEHITMEVLSREFAFSADYLSKIFKQKYGVTPLGYLMDVRIRQAKLLLESDFALGLRQISGQTGFTDKFHFSKTFKKMTGISPQAYKEQHSKETSKP